VTPKALLVVRGRVDDVRGWARAGLLPVWIVPDVAWTLVVPAGPPASAPPYDDPVALLGGRPLPSRARPAICLVADGPRAVVTVHQSGRRAVPRWLVWCRGAGLQRLTDLPSAPAALLADLAAGAGSGASASARRAGRRDALRGALVADDRSGADVVDDVLRALALPGAGLTLDAVRAGDLPGAVRVDPDERVVARFDAFAAHEAELSGQLGRGR
jgi:hypothetical protein